MISIDTNLLIYAHRSALAEHRAARRALEQAIGNPRGCGVALFCLAEFWSVVTHPASAGRPSSSREASQFLAALIAAGLAVWAPGPGFAERLTQLATDLRVAGARIFDLQIALSSFDNGANEIWTHDANFSAIPGLAVINPLSSK